MNQMKLSPLAQELLSHWGDRTLEITPFGDEALTCEKVCEISKLSMDALGKAMVVSMDKNPVIILLPGNKRLDIKKSQKTLNATKLSIAPKEVTAKLGLILGAVTPLFCLKRQDIPLAIDASLLEKSKINISSGDPKFGVNVKPEDLKAFAIHVGDFAQES